MHDLFVHKSYFDTFFNKIHYFSSILIITYITITHLNMAFLDIMVKDQREIQFSCLIFTI
jgi:hypothetical protein